MPVWSLICDETEADTICCGVMSGDKHFPVHFLRLLSAYMVQIKLSEHQFIDFIDTPCNAVYSTQLAMHNKHTSFADGTWMSFLLVLLVPLWPQMNGVIKVSCLSTAPWLSRPCWGTQTLRERTKARVHMLASVCLSPLMETAELWPHPLQSAERLFTWTRRKCGTMLIFAVKKVHNLAVQEKIKLIFCVLLN